MGRNERREERERRRWAAEMTRRLEELDRIDREHGLGTLPAAVPPGRRGRRGRRGGRSSRGRHPHALTLRGAVPAGIVVVLLVGVAVALAPATAPLRDWLGLGRYGDRPAYVDGDGTYAFVLTQPGSDEPVGYDPCTDVEVAINPENAPEDHRELVDVALARISEASGLRMVVVGDTDDRDIDSRGSGFGPAPPVLVAWADEDEVDDLAGAVAGIGGSAASEVGGRLGFVTGIVVLDVDAFEQMADQGLDEARQAVVDHEFGHVVGLDHVDDPGELMYPETRVTSFGPGDLEGLGRLGSIACR
ncbi:matrixin family metalloprotease [Nocardioides zeae]|uniref:Matrixin family metalloprotease n=1 Tax=Nocardioides imazamoxiresistens TaxID=3231893 RepID=A0ABU3PXK7_9ACTN|nr:matrixin family metalloprotease [Nocardioides zeae]MDT9593964.1 matrixin family metalloprotease [Nocardioides zeae]